MMDDLQQALELFQTFADGECFSGVIDRNSGLWWVQFISIHAGKTIKTMPAINSDLNLAIRDAIASHQRESQDV